MGRQKKVNVLYMVIDPKDEQELPIFTGTVEEVAKYCNTTVDNVRSAISHAKARGQKSKYVRVDFEEDYLRGNGCNKHSDCFTCPFPDCIIGDENDEYKRLWREKNREKVRLYQRDYREKKKNEQNNNTV